MSTDTRGGPRDVEREMAQKTRLDLPGQAAGPASANLSGSSIRSGRGGPGDPAGATIAFVRTRPAHNERNPRDHGIAPINQGSAADTRQCCPVRWPTMA